MYQNSSETEKYVETANTSHNKGEFRGTKQFKPWKMEWCSLPMSVNDAIRLEAKLRKHKTNANMLEHITFEHDNPKPKF